MERDVNSVLCALIELLVNKLQKLENEMEQLLFLCEIEDTNLKYYERIGCFLMQALAEETTDLSTVDPFSFQSLSGILDNSDKEHRVNSFKKWGLPESDIKEKESRRNVYIPKYEWTEERTQRLLDSVQRHYSNLTKNKDYTKPIWEIIRMEVDSSDPHLKWYTCRHKWSHLESDYNNYIKDLQEYSGRNIGHELNVYVPHYYEHIGIILRNSGQDNVVRNHSSSEVLQKMLEDRIGEVLKTTTWEELGKRDDEELITITGIDVNLSND